MTNGDGPGGLESGNAYPRISQAIGLLVLASVFKLLVVIPVWISTRPHTGARSAAVALVEALSMGLVILWAYGRSGSSAHAVFPVKLARLSAVAPIVLMLLGATLLVLETNYLMRLVWPKPASFVKVESCAEGTSGTRSWHPWRSLT